MSEICLHCILRWYKKKNKEYKRVNYCISRTNSKWFNSVNTLIKIGEVSTKLERKSVYKSNIWDNKKKQIKDLFRFLFDSAS